MNWVDVFLAVVVLLGLASGISSGFVLGTVLLLTLAGSLLAALAGTAPAAAFLQARSGFLGVWTQPVCFIVIFVLAQMLLGGIAGALTRAVPRGAHLHPVNRFLGIAPGFVNGLVNATVIGVLLLTLPLPLPDRVHAEARDSRIVEALSGPAEWLQAELTPIFDPAVRRSLQSLTVKPDSRERVDLPFRVTQPRVRPELEARMLELVNEERAKQGLKPLKADPEIAEVARRHSRDMFARGYFSHVSPDGGTLEERLRAGQVRYLTAGENLALAQTLPAAHQGLMNSPGHRANILRPQFGRVGIGVLDGGRHGLMVTQNFRN